jgi:alpha-beta hydrolase superfamily lysophospholipase
MIETTSWVDCDDGAKLFVRRWKGETGKPAALVHLVHGMAEHSLRYRRLAEKLCSHGFEVWAADMRGHGKTADLSVNDKSNGGLLGHTADKNGFSRVVEDIRVLMKHIAARIKAEYGEIPVFIMGHSWGSFLVQGYIEYPVPEIPLAGCILSGTRGPGGGDITVCAPVFSLLAALKGSQRFSKISDTLSLGPYNKPFKPNRTPFDWLSRDKNEVDAYIADPLCGIPCSSGFFRDMIGGIIAIHRKEAIEKIDRNLPVYIFCGNADPVGEMGHSPTMLVEAYRAHGINALEFVMYPQARHETLNETNRDEVTEDILNWLTRRLNDTGK